MEKRLPLALVLSLLFVWLYIGLTGPPPKDSQPAATGVPEVAAPESVAVAPLPAGGGAGAGGARDDPPESSRALAFAGDGYVAQFETRGAALAWLELTDYHTEIGATDRLRLVGPIDGVSPNLLLRDFADAWGLDRTKWEVEEGPGESGRARLVFRKRLDNGLALVRTVEDRGQRCAFDLSVEVINDGGEHLPGTLSFVLQGARGLVQEQAENTLLSTPPTALAVVSGADGTTVTKWSGEDLSTGAPRRIGPGETLLAAGSMTNYFGALLAPGADSPVALVQPEAVLDAAQLQAAVEERHPFDEAAREALRRQLAGEHRGNAAANLLLASTPPAPGLSVRWDFTVFAGPLDDKLAASGGHAYLQPVVEDRHGSMAWINRALLAVMRLFHAATGNWGVAIILLTLLVRVVLFPLNRVQQASMQRYASAMQRLKPQIDAIKAKYKNNLRKFNEEQMALLKQEGVRPPLGGCLLIFLQFPIWISLFQILRSSIELRHAPFMAWVTDLSRPDDMPFPGLGSIHLLPILMAVAQLLQMRMQPKPVDDSQAQMQKMMAIFMPVMMLFFLYSYPSGLSLYIFTSSLFGILEYQLVKKLWPPPAVAAAAPARAGGKG